MTWPKFGLHDRSAEQLEPDDLTRMAALNPAGLMSVHTRRDRWNALHQAMPSSRFHARLDFRGELDSPKGDAVETARLAREFGWVASWRCRNEPQLETPQTTIATWQGYLFEWFTEARKLCPAGTRLAIPAIAPGVNGRAWLEASVDASKDAGADILDIHAYGTPAEIEDWVWYARSLWRGPIIVSESNPGPGIGRRAQIERWPHDLGDIRARLEKYNLTDVILFSWLWQPDFPMDLAPNIKHTPVEAEVARLNRQSAPVPQPTPPPPPGGRMTVIDPDRLEFWHQWQIDRNTINQDPRDVAAFKRHLAGVGADPAGVADWGVPVTTAPVPPAYAPTVTLYQAPVASIQGTYANTPKGVILHSSRSGQSWSEVKEFEATARYCQSGTGGSNLAWTHSIGPDRLGTHLDPVKWGWNAGADSGDYLAVEFAQAHLGDAISDAQVNAFCFAFGHIYRKRWPNLPKVFPMHSELPQGAAKSDAFPRNSAEANIFRGRILKRLQEMGVS